MNGQDPYAPPTPAEIAARPLPVPEPTGPVVPRGTAREVLTWVDGDAEKAQMALEAELAEDPPRKSLVGELKKITGAA